MNDEQRKALREPFDPRLIGKLPKKDKYGRAFEVDYVGHAAVTDRLLTVDPGWTIQVDAEYPGAGEGYGLRGTMTVAGISRPEYGEGKTPKEAMSDLIKRCAMRFGVALDLWSKEELQASGGTTVEPPSPWTDATAGPSEPAPSETSAAPVGSADAAAPDPDDASRMGKAGTSEGSGAAPIFGPCKTCGGTEYRTIDTPRGKRQACGGCRRAAE